ncbi:MAG: hypothetical protein IJ626_03665 [Muribaculaceae bacterium]|nr:hypothetical protein [Muribaculaceae bacterium]
MKNKGYFTAVICVLLCYLGAAGFGYHNDTQKVRFFDYSQFYFTYEENGETKTACLTDEALTPEHQIALLKEVYTNPNIPGIHYGYDYRDADGNKYQNRKINYDNYGHKGETDACFWLGTAADTYPNPIQNGMTMLLVTVKDTWKVGDHNKYTNAIDYFRNAVASIKLCKDFIRVDEDTTKVDSNPGYLFVINNEGNRFFFISKGKARCSYTKPFYRLFEQISPVNDWNTGDVSSLYDAMLAGAEFNCYHDCSNVFSLTTTLDNGTKLPHWFEVSSMGENYNMNNLSIFVPDRRFEYEMAPDTYSDIANNTSIRYFNEYGNSQNAGEEVEAIMPHVVLFTADLEAKATRSSQRGYYDIRLDWSSAFTGMDLPEHYWVYQYDPVTGSRTLITTIDAQPTREIYDVFSVEQQEDPQTFYYVVTAAPIVYGDDGSVLIDSETGEPKKTIYADSPIRKVTVPGKDPFYAQDAEYRSRYEVMKDKNVYKNTITLMPEGTDDYARIKNNHDAFALTRTDEAGVKVKVADIVFDAGAEGGYSYTVTYNESSQDLVDLFDDEEPSVSGQFDDFDNATVKLIDRFSASTATNTHSGYYNYLIEQDGLDFSNVLNVKVYKTEHTVVGVGHTKEAVDNDTVRALDLGPYTADVISAINDPLADLLQYEVYRVRNNEPTKIGKASNTLNDGVYHIFGLGTDNMLTESCGTVAIDRMGGELAVIDRNPGHNKGFSFVPMVTIAYDRKRMLYNTYGSDKKEVSYPNVSISIAKTGGKNDIKKSYPFSNGYAPRMAYRARLNITPTLTGDVNDVYRYRVWRYNGTTLTELESETLLNSLPDVSGVSYSSDGVEASWGTDYAYLKDLYPGTGTISFTDLYIDLPITESQSKTVTYYVRMYAMDGTGGANPARRKVIYYGEGADYFVAENFTKVTYNKGVQTEIDEVDIDPEQNEVEDVTFYNVLGMPRKEPVEGVNIVVTRYRNGTFTTEKRIMY